MCVCMHTYVCVCVCDTWLMLARTITNCSIHRILFEKESKLIAVHKATYFKVPKGVMMGPGPFIEALESSTGKKALFVGKPEPTFFYSVLKDIQCIAAETVMIGDVCSVL